MTDHATDTLVLREPTKTLRVRRSAVIPGELLIDISAGPHTPHRIRISEAGSRKLIRLLAAKIEPGQYTERQRRLLRADLERLGII